MKDMAKNSQSQISQVIKMFVKLPRYNIAKVL